MKYKIGSKVLCIEGTATNSLREGEIYTIREVEDNDYIKLENVKYGSARANRFIPDNITKLEKLIYGVPD